MPGDSLDKVVVPVLEDLIDEDPEEFTVQLTSPVNAELQVGTATGRILDNDERGLETSVSVLEIEEGSSASYFIKLLTVPSSDVVIEIRTGPGDISASPASVLFTSENWQSPQAVKVSAAEDDDAVQDAPIAITHLARGGDYEGLAGGTVTVTIRENDSPGIIIEPAELTIEEGDTGFYSIALASEPAGAVQISVTASLEDTDIRVDPRRVTFSPADWTRPKGITVSALEDDDVDQDAPVRLTHRASGADYEGLPVGDVLVTITEDETTWDLLSVDWLSRLGRTVASQTVAAVSARLMTPNSRRNRLSVGALETAAEQYGPGSGDLLPDANGLRPAKLLWQDDIDLHVGTGSEDEAGRLAMWARADRTTFGGSNLHGAMDGELYTGFVGADYERRRALMGVGMSFTRARGDYDYATDFRRRGEIATELTSFISYGRYRFASRLAAWTVMGLGRGPLSLNESTSDTLIETDIKLGMGAAGVTGALLRPENSGGFGLDLKSDGFFARASAEPGEAQTSNYGDAYRIRVSLAASMGINLGAGATLTPSVEATARQDGGHAETGAGALVRGSVRLATRRFLLEAEGRRLVIHQDAEYEEWAVSGTFRLMRSAEGLGPRLSISPAREVGVSNASLYRSAATTGQLPALSNAGHGRLDAEAGYGMRLPRKLGLFAPYAATDISGASGHILRIGGRWRMPHSIRIHLEGGRRTSGYGATQHQLSLRAALSW